MACNQKVSDIRSALRCRPQTPQWDLSSHVVRCGQSAPLADLFATCQVMPRRARAWCLPGEGHFRSQVLKREKCPIAFVWRTSFRCCREAFWSASPSCRSQAFTVRGLGSEAFSVLRRQDCEDCLARRRRGRRKSQRTFGVTVLQR